MTPVMFDILDYSLNLGKNIGGIENKRKNRAHPDHKIAKINQNT